MFVVLRKKKEANSVVENMLVALVGIVMVTAFLVIIFGAFAGISDKWQISQVAREYMLLMETEGYLTDSDKALLESELESLGMYDISFEGSTLAEAGYGERIYLKIRGTYDNNILLFAGGISKYTKSPSIIEIKRQSTSKQ